MDIKKIKQFNKMRLEMGLNTYRYAQKNSGNQLHLVQDYGYGRVSSIAKCGMIANWRMTINVPLGHCCKLCLKRNKDV